MDRKILLTFQPESMLAEGSALVSNATFSGTGWSRVGGQKQLLYVTEGANKGYLEENPTFTKPKSSIIDSDNDLVGLGFGINVENRLRIDFVAAEDLAYTFTNLFSAPQHHLFNRVSATYSF